MEQLQDVLGKSLRDPVKCKLDRGVDHIHKTDWKILAEPPAASTPVLMPSATVGEDVSERERGGAGG